MTLETSPNLGAEADDLYAELLAAHEGLSAEESAALNARLVLTLMNHVGDAEAIRAAIALASAARR
ncbi:DUF2783 domain-containing protein [Pontivivens ytuae]|uniref:DUF2783 domain-containing protein n=1 Tax=Pontivivens ytuae TaxID=2789856 RepID=A0A7S9LRL0_9RHOB|nr:DUF2783 domain-containing protein [Pontivivens ytuae]QPH53460.1 DUF2783 domain-containing protein [Pontivivens ytuae]